MKDILDINVKVTDQGKNLVVTLKSDEQISILEVRAAFDKVISKLLEHIYE